MDGRVKTLHPKIHGGLLGPARHRRRGDGRARHRADRPAGGEPVSVRGDRRAVPTARSTTRSRTSTSAARRCCARRRRTTQRVGGRRRSRATTPRLASRARRRRHGARRSARGSRRKAFAHTARYDAAIAITSARARRRRPALPRPLHCIVRARRDAALRRKPAPARRRSTRPAGARASLASARQLQGKELSFNNLADADAALECVQAVRRARLRDRQARQSLRRRDRRDTRCEPTTAPTRPTRPPRSAASSRSTARSTRRPREAILERQFVEVLIAPEFDARRARACSRRSRTCACSRPAHGRGATHDSRLQARRRRPAGADAATSRCDGRRATCRSSRSARRPTASSTTCCSPGGWRSTSSPTRSSTRATDARSASAPGQMSRVVSREDRRAQGRGSGARRAGFGDGIATRSSRSATASMPPPRPASAR